MDMEIKQYLTIDENDLERYRQNILQGVLPLNISWISMNDI